MPVHWPVPVLVPTATHFVIFACPPTVFKFFANYFAINKLQTCTICMLVCAGAGLLASASGQSFCYFCLSTHANYVFQFFCQLFRHKLASNLHQMYASMCRCQCRSVGQCRRPVIFLNFCPSAHTIDVFQFFCQLFRHK